MQGDPSLGFPSSTPHTTFLPSPILPQQLIDNDSIFKWIVEERSPLGQTFPTTGGPFPRIIIIIHQTIWDGSRQIIIINLIFPLPFPTAGHFSFLDLCASISFLLAPFQIQCFYTCKRALPINLHFWDGDQTDPGLDPLEFLPFPPHYLFIVHAFSLLPLYTHTYIFECYFGLGSIKFGMDEMNRRNLAGGISPSQSDQSITPHLPHPFAICCICHA